MRVTVLGADGFLGSHLVDRFLDEGHEVTGLVRSPRLTNLTASADRLSLVEGSLGDFDVVQRAIENSDVVFHMVWATNAAVSWDSPLQEIDENVRPTLKLMEGAAEAAVKKVVFPSSGGTVYGRQTGALTERHAVRPFSPYGIAKATAEFFMQSLSERYDVALDIYRIGNPYGPRQRATKGQGVIAHWLEAAMSGQTLRVIGDEHTIRDYVYIDDVTELMAVSFDDLSSSGIYNLGTGTGTSIVELFERFRVHFPEVDWKKEPARPFDNPSAILDSQRLLSRRPSFQLTPLEIGLKRTCQAARQ